MNKTCMCVHSSWLRALSTSTYRCTGILIQTHIHRCIYTREEEKDHVGLLSVLAAEGLITSHAWLKERVRASLCWNHPWWSFGFLALRSLNLSRGLYERNFSDRWAGWLTLLCQNLPKCPLHRRIPHTLTKNKQPLLKLAEHVTRNNKSLWFACHSARLWEIFNL